MEDPASAVVATHLAGRHETGNGLKALSTGLTLGPLLGLRPLVDVSSATTAQQKGICAAIAPSWVVALTSRSTGVLPPMYLNRSQRLQRKFRSTARALLLLVSLFLRVLLLLSPLLVLLLVRTRRVCLVSQSTPRVRADTERGCL